MTQPVISRPFHDNSGILHHVELDVADFEASVEFWDWLLSELGYSRYQEMSNSVSWRRRDTCIVLVRSSTDQPSDDHKHRSGLNHLAFHARSRRQVDDLSRELRRRGATIVYDGESSEKPRAPYAVHFEDPNHIQLELVAPD